MKTAILLAFAAGASPAWAQGEPKTPPTPPSDLTDLSLEDLLNVDVEVTSVSKRPQSLASSAAAVYVLTGEDIRRSGARSIPEALRMVPGLDVARVNGSTWAISSRGFNGQFANKLLVLIDGRSVYSPAFSGVWWDIQDVLLEDIDRIEVIRGPGAALWGANAVNGVINIITKPAAKTQGAFVEVGGGTEENGFTSARYGGSFGKTGHYRVYAKYFDRTGLDEVDQTGIADDWSQGRFGFRTDWSPSETDSLTVQGDAYRVHADGPSSVVTMAPPFTSTGNIDTNADGGNLLARWTHVLSTESDFSLQAYYDDADRTLRFASEHEHTLDVDYQQRLRLGDRNDLMFGLGFRRVESEMDGSSSIQVDPEHEVKSVLSAFVQDEIVLTKDRLSLILGAKYEHNDFTGSEVAPNARLVWTPDPKHTVWGAVSRAVRTPSLVERDVTVDVAVIPGPGFNSILRVNGDKNFVSEDLTAYEVGYRVQPRDDLSFDLATFYNDYSHLASFEPGTPFLQGADVVVPLAYDNKLHGQTWGAELATQWNVRPDWRLHAGYTLLLMNLVGDADSHDPITGDLALQSPKNQFNLRSSHDLSDQTQLDLDLYYVDSLPGSAPSYVRVDTRLGWRPRPAIDISFVVQGLFHNHDLEFGQSQFGGHTGVDTAAFVIATWKF
jgi:iron complex outermembrane receptor protein